MLAARWRRRRESAISRSSRRTSVVGRMALSVYVRVAVSEVSGLEVDESIAESAIPLRGVTANVSAS